MFLEQQIRILEIYEDHVTEDWSNDAEYSVLTSQEFILHLHLKIY